jgi:hypothetical protein
MEAEVNLQRTRGARHFIEIQGQRYPLIEVGDSTTIGSLSFAMPDHTPVGTVSGTLMLGTYESSAVVTVEEQPRVRIEPGAVSLEASAGESRTITLMVENSGNVTIEPHIDATVTVRPVGSFGRGVREGFAKSSGDIAQRLVALGEHIAAERSHELAVTNEASLEAIEVGAQAEIALSIQLPDDLDLTLAWTGRLALMGASVSIKLQATRSN